MLSRRTIAISAIIAILLAAGVFAVTKYGRRSSDVLAPVGADWPPLAYLEATDDVSIITGTFEGMADDDRFRLTTTREVVTPEGTYLDTQTNIAVFGADSEVRSATTGNPLGFTALVRLAPGTPVFVLVQRAMQDEPTVNAYVVIVPEPSIQPRP